ncbi:YqaE/Pmp3 family membrane protein [Aeoliella sp. ICT_H6.2]|uniref:YqaE/Pmp3 family membrane protein n=1 Tax=Aeoliella straminimaris TaxID=2954799 RepID=A0A9X2JJ26_9BACT|nr:YqaE/Pmp3 family membrane protein [Aeoliella straminimaris]MCO6047710.1 YqaE/Pmp3 family membrane protein [Aeoliella straminimaris]
MKVVKVILSIFLPPVAAFLQVGVSTHFWINIILTLLGGIPGVVHALWLVLGDKTA